MATYTSNYAWTKPGGNDQVDISVLNGNLDSQDAIMHKAFDNMAQAFSQLSTYAVGDIVLYDNDLYKCHTAVVTPGSWTGSTNWTSWTLAEGGGGGGTSDYPDLTNKPQVNGVTLTGNKTTSDLGINADNVMMSDSVTSVEDALDEITESLNEYVEITNSGNESLSHMLDRLYAAIDGTKITRKSTLFISNVLYLSLTIKTSSALRYSQASMATSNNSFSITGVTLQSSESTACQSSTGATGTTSFNIFSGRTTDTSVRLYY